MMARLLSWPIRTKLTVTFALLIAIISALMFFYYPAKLRQEANNTMLTKAESIARMTSYSISPALYFQDQSTLEEAVAGARRNSDLIYLVLLDKAGQVISSFNPAKTDASTYQQARQGPLILRAEKACGVFVPVTADAAGGGETIGELFLGLSLTELESRIAAIRRTSALVSATIFGIGLILVYGISALITGPLGRMTEAVKKIADGDLTRRAAIGASDEVGNLAHSFNVMVDRLEKARSELRTLNSDLERRVEERTTALRSEVQERTRAETAMRLAKEEAEAANRAKSDFLASMSHELRTPLNAIIGFSQVLEERYYGELNPKQTEYVGDILDSAQHLLALINDILDISRIEVGKMELDYGRFSLVDFLEHSLVMVREKCQKHAIQVGLRVPQELAGREIWADARRLKQVLFNILSNAAKFTPDGGSIEVTAADAPGSVVISVRDTGIGLAPAALEKVFEPFFQVKSGIQDKTPGAGLGLSVSRQIMDLHGGRIWAESEGNGRGSRFLIQIPVAGPGRPPGKPGTGPKTPPAPTGPGARDDVSLESSPSGKD